MPDEYYHQVQMYQIFAIHLKKLYSDLLVLYNVLIVYKLQFFLLDKSPAFLTTVTIEIS